MNEADATDLWRLSRDVALAELARMRASRDLAIVQGLLHQNVLVRNEVATALAEFDPDQVVEEIVGLGAVLSHQSHRLAGLITALLDARRKRLAPLLRGALDAENALVRLVSHGACLHLANYGHEAFQFLQTWHQIWQRVTDSHEARLALLTARGNKLALSPTRRFTDLLISLLETPDEPVQRAALRAVGTSALNIIAQDLAQAILSLARLAPQVTLRCAAIDALQGWNRFETDSLRDEVDALICDCLVDPEPQVRYAAARWVLECQPGAATTLAEHFEPQVREAWFRVAYPTTQQLTRAEVRAWYLDWLANANDLPLAEHTAVALLRDPTGFLLPRLLGDPRPSVRAAILHELASQDSEKWLDWWPPLVLGFLSDPLPGIRALALRLHWKLPESLQLGDNALQRHKAQAIAWVRLPLRFGPEGEPTEETLLRARHFREAIEEGSWPRQLVLWMSHERGPWCAGARRLLEILANSDVPFLGLLREEDTGGRVALALDLFPYPLRNDAPFEPLGPELHGIAGVERHWRASFASGQPARQIRAIEHLAALLTQQIHPHFHHAMLYGDHATRRRMAQELC